MQGNTMPNISIVIPFYNNRSIAPYCLPGVVRLLDEHSGVNEIMDKGYLFRNNGNN
jgi:glycosyltransferase involved in cell wall biosynthesis